MNRVSVERVRQGMIVDEPVYAPGSNQLLLQHGAVITPRMLVALKFHGIKSLSISIPDSLFINPCEGLAKFLNHFFEMKISEICPEQREGNLNDDMPVIAARMKNILRQLTKSQEILELCMEIKLVDNKRLFYPAIYSCVRSVLVAGAMNLSEEETYNIGAAALLQNLGLCEMAYLLGIPQRDESQEALWREHCQYGYYFAKEKGISPDIAKLIICHHEQFDGGGFPKQLKGEAIPMGAKIISLCSDFDEMVFDKRMQPYEIAEIFYAAGDGKYDSRVIDAFILNIPLYPLGSVVRLSNKEVGVVVNVRKNLGPKPIVRICYNRCNKPFTDTTTIDMGTESDLVIEEVLS